jgi:2-C-methyl-D-erythritol 2,4-cyclodiphosphate synthase
MLSVGNGFDLHRLAPERPFVLGGISLDWPKGPIGHSDGDVLLHALIDALLGATGLGDIGETFPDSDPAFKDADSADLLKQVMAHLEKHDWLIANIDTTILLEAPKLAEYKPQIKANLAALTGVDAHRIGVKAKTMEGLGPIGKNEAVAAFVTVLLEQMKLF